jgi:hypothetical protein
MKRMLMIGLAVLALCLVTVAAVQADKLEGSGTIRAIGAGLSRVHGTGRVDIAAKGIGTVWVRNARTIQATGRGFRQDLPGGVTLFAGWAGRIHIAGEGMTVEMAGGVIEFKATGTGTVFLQGRGRYWVAGQAYDWTSAGVTANLTVE